MNYNLYAYHFCRPLFIVLGRVPREESEYDLIYVSGVMGIPREHVRKLTALVWMLVRKNLL